MTTDQPSTPTQAGQSHAAPNTNSTKGTEAAATITPRNDAEHRQQRLVELIFPTEATRVFWAAVVVSLLLLAASLFVKTSTIGADSVGNVLAALGAGILLAAFGSQATVRTGQFILAGAAATSMVLLWALETFDHRAWERAQQGYVVGTISGVPAKTFSVAFRRNDAFWATHDRNDVGFVALMGSLTKSDTSRLTLTIKGERERIPYCKINPDFECEEMLFDVPTQALLQSSEKALRELNWRFDARDASFYDSANKKIFGIQTTARVGSNLSTGGAVRSARWKDVLFAPAQAAETSQELQEALRDLTSEDTSTRRAARDTLAAGTPAWVPTIVAHMRNNYANYRARLGCSVALAEMLRDNKSQAKQIQALLSPEDLRLLLAAASDKDRTVRVYASEFLYDLGDPRTVLPSIELAAKADDDGKYNLMLVTTAGSGFLRNSSDKNAARTQLEAIRANSGERTRVLIDKSLANLQ